MTQYDVVTILAWYSGGYALIPNTVWADNEDHAAGIACELNEFFEESGAADIRDVIVLGPSSQEGEL